MVPTLPPSSRMQCFYDPGYYFPLPETHPFPMDKFWRAEALIRETAGARVSIQAAPPASEEHLRRVHTADYLESIRRGSLDHLAALKLGLPAGEALLDRSRLEVGGTLAATWAALDTGLAANLAGGTHHAFPDRGLGYCVLNDVAVAIRAVHARFATMRVFVIDTDAHQGNGTHGIFADDKRVFTYSIHVGKNYPAIKTPGSMDVELPRYVAGDEYLARLTATLGPALRTFRPDLIYWIGGADPHAADRFGQMTLSDTDMASRDRHVIELLRAQAAPGVLLYGGGYNTDRVHTAQLHARMVCSAVAC